MKVYLMVTTWSGWEDPEANGSMVHVFGTKQKAIDYMEKALKEEIEQEKEFGRDFHETTHLEQFVSIVSQYSEYVEFEVYEREVM